MLIRRGTRFLGVFSALSAVALLATPIALADNDHNRADKDDHPRVAHVQQLGDRDDVQVRDDDDAAMNAAAVRLDNLINAINSDVTNLSNLNIDEDDPDDAVNPKVLRTVSLAALESGLSSTAAAEVTNAVNANSGALQTFLNGGSAQATTVDAALNAAGVSTSSALAVFALDDGRLIVLTA